VNVDDVAGWLETIYVAADGATLREEERRKARQVAALLEEVERAVRRRARREPLLMVDAAAGKSYVGLLAAKLVFERLGVEARVVAIEREAARIEASRRACDRLGLRVPVECRCADVAEAAAWPAEAAIVTALHACGPAADTVIERSVETRAQTLLLVPCCTGRAVRAMPSAERLAGELSIPRHAPVRRRFLQAIVDAERTWHLEASGYETEVVEFVAATVTPHNLLWRARRVGEPTRMRAAGRAWRAVAFAGADGRSEA
jgi:hypothetical protein